ncbi:MAG: glycosyltransferase family 4 protein [Terracidiphilus sp.]
MRILVNDFGGAAYESELSRELARRGHCVLHVFFADNHSTPKGEIRAGNGDSSNFTIEGLHVPMKFSKHSIRTRRKADIAYGKAVAGKVVSFKPDVVISANMPLDAQDILQRTAMNHNTKFVFWMTEVYSFAVRYVLKRKLGPLAGPIARHYERLERRLLKKSDAVVCITPEFRNLAIDWGVEPSRIHVIENWAPLSEVLPTDKDNPWSREQGMNGKFCFMYSGTLGSKHRPELLLALARYLQSRGNAHLVVVAAGPGAEWLEANARDIQKDVLTILPLQPYKKISEMLGASDVLIALLDSNASVFAVPSKIPTYLCAGRALIVAVPRENQAAAVVEQAEAGIVISPDSACDFVNAAKELMENSGLRARYAANARAYAERSFDIVGITDRFLQVLSR